MQVDQLHTLHFIGIGGIGMSALARYFHSRGVQVSGYDRTPSALTRAMEKEGIAIHYEEAIERIPEAVQMVVYTPAVPNTHRELRWLRSRGVPVKKRAEILGMISRSKRTLAVAGTHGKTTTSSMLAHLLRSGGVEATAFLGGIALNFESNYVYGEGDWVVVEADEFDRSFLHLDPEMAVILSMDADHLDIYGDYEQMLATGFRAFAQKIKPGGKLWIRAGLESQLVDDGAAVLSFGIDAGLYRAENVRVENGRFVFDFTGPQQQLTGLVLPLPGRHNVENATAAIALALAAGVDADAIGSGLASFRGIKRRFEMIFQDDQRAYIDDYAHHPTELTAAIAAARELFPGRKVTGIFQPHLFTRTRDFAEGFARALDDLDELWMLDIYPAREDPIPGVDAQLILDKMKSQHKRLLAKAEVLPAIESNDWEVLLTLGAGDIDRLVSPIRDWLVQTGDNHVG